MSQKDLDGTKYSSLMDITDYPFKFVATNVTLYKQTIMNQDTLYERVVNNIYLQGIELYGVVVIGRVYFSVIKHIDKEYWEVVSVTGHDDSKAIPAKTRREVTRRDNYTCQRCGSTSRLHIDHIFPRSRGGDDSMDNLQVLCESCNLTKSDGRLAKSPRELKPSIIEDIHTPEKRELKRIRVYVKSFRLEIPTTNIINEKGIIYSVLGVLIVRKSYRKSDKPEPIQLARIHNYK